MDPNLFLIKRKEGDADRQDFQFLETLESAAGAMMQKGEVEKALEYMQQALTLRRSYYGENSSEAIGYCRLVVRKVVVAAVQMIETTDPLVPLQLLHRLEAIVSLFPTGKLVPETCDVFNNIACAYRKHGKLPLAKEYIMKALKLGSVYKDAPVDRAATNLNMCAILSSQHQHNAALDYGLKAVQNAQEDLVSFSLGKQGDISHKITVLAVAYHNVGVEEEHLKRFENALDWYRKALKFLEQHGQEQHKSVLREFEKTYKSAVKALGKKMQEREEMEPPVRKRPSSAYKPERKMEVLSPISGLTSKPVSDNESDQSVSLQHRLPVSSSHNKLKSQRLIPKKRTNSPGARLGQFDTRYPLEGKPSTFEAIRKQKFRQASPGFAKSPGTADSSVNRTGQSRLRRKDPEPINTESEEDIKELEAMGLLDYSLEPTRREVLPRERNPMKKIRGKRAKMTSPRTRQNQENFEHLPRVRDAPLRSKAEDALISSPGPFKIQPESEKPRYPMPGIQMGMVSPSPPDISLSSGRHLASRQISSRRLLSAHQSPLLLTEKISSENAKTDFFPADSRLMDREKRGDESNIKKAVIRIQANFRRLLALRKVRILKDSQARKATRSLISRSGKSFRNGRYGLISLYREKEGLLISVSIFGETAFEIRVSATLENEPKSLVEAVDFSETGELILDWKKNEASPELAAALKLQAAFRGAADRRKCRLLKSAKSKPRQLVYRHVRNVEGKYLIFCIFQETEGLFLVTNFKDSELAVKIPTDLQKKTHLEIIESALFSEAGLSFPGKVEEESKSPIQSPRNLTVAQNPFSSSPRNSPDLHQSGDQKPPKTELPGPETPSSPSSPNTHSPEEENLSFSNPAMAPGVLVKEYSAEDHSKAAIIQSVFRMKKDKANYDQMLQKARANKEVIARQETVLKGDSYLVTISKLQPAFIEVEAYPLTQIETRPEKSVYDEREIVETFEWTEGTKIQDHCMKLLDDVRLEMNAAVLGKMYRKPTVYKTYKSFNDSHLYEVIFTHLGTDIEIKIEPEDGENPGFEQIDPILMRETTLRSIAKIDRNWTPQNYERVSSLLNIINEELILAPESDPQGTLTPMITISESQFENVLSTSGYSRQERPSLYSQNHSGIRRENAALLIQKTYRKHHAMADFSFASRKKVGFRNILFHGFRLFPGNRLFAVFFSKIDRDLRIRAEELDSQKQYDLVLREKTDFESMETLDFDDISRHLWTKKEGLGVFLLGNMTEIHRKAATTMEKLVRGHMARKIYPKLKEENERKLTFCRKKTFGTAEMGVALYLFDPQIQIECFHLRKTASQKAKSSFSFFRLSELEEIYAGLPSSSQLFSDVIYDHGQISLLARTQNLETRQQAYLAAKSSGETRSIIRTSSKLDDRMWVVTMSVMSSSEDMMKPKEDDVVEFCAFCSGQQIPLRTKTTVEELARLTHLPSANIYPIGSMAIKRLLKVRDKALVLDMSVPIPRVDALAALIQAHIRGFITRRKFIHMQGNKSMLLACQTLVIDDCTWVLYAYRDPPFIKLEAVDRTSKVVLTTAMSDNIFSKFPPTLTKKRIVESFIFPKIRLVTETGTKHLRVTKSMQLHQSILEKYQGKIKVVNSQTEKTSASQASHKEILSNLGASPEIVEPNDSSRGSEPLSPDKVERTNTREESERRSSGTLLLSFVGETNPSGRPGDDSPRKRDGPTLPFRKGNLPLPLDLGLSSSVFDTKKPVSSVKTDQIQSPFFPENVPVPTLPDASPKSSHPDQELLVRSGLEIDNHYYVASVYSEERAVFIELNNPETHERVGRRLSLNEEIQDVEQYCGELLNRIGLRTGRNGVMEIEVREAEEVVNVLYKKSHYVSSRYCIVTVYENRLGIVISAFDPAQQKTLELKVGHRNLQPAEQVQREIAGLVKKLRIQELLGEETLIIAFN